ncbi:MAG: IclR family transcriptional regulator [Alphaproteobacteria bacterium]|nr:IclR family transcriptional regulator [Alphaproteobacteria bacterium]
MTTTDKTPPNLRMLAIISCLSAQGSPMSLMDFVVTLGWPKQTLHRLIISMTDQGYLEREGRFYAPSRHMQSIANGILQFAPALSIRRNILLELSEETRETINFVMPTDEGMTYIDRIDTNWPFRILLPVGSHVPFHCTASGKAYLAHLRSGKKQRLLAELKLNAHTEKTHTSVASLDSDLRAVRKHGFALDDEEFLENMLAIAVPVFDDQGRYFASLAIHGPKQRFSRDMALGAADRLKHCAERITKATFEHPSYDDAT